MIRPLPPILLLCTLSAACSTARTQPAEPETAASGEVSHGLATSGLEPGSAQAMPAGVASGPAFAPGTGLYALQTETLEGEPFDLARYQGDVTLVVNVASNCGFAVQYEGLSSLQQDFAPKGFQVVAFPCNDFGRQEPGSAGEIRAFCQERASFPVLEKVRIRVGTGQSPVYRWLGTHAGTLPTWNFCKYLVGRDGEVLRFFSSNVTPESGELRTAVAEALLEQQ